ncbi:YkoF family thiamine/hydroxymethylpyrimidine-binding protein [Sporosarcina highlanderae]|uniref:YkoF family thiamine/hydroxymethylpyrimidine-binding protein n=1 Tax=Sporosarcina highlanderae TaxID=3035916 RepID=A0ABT8JT50_9BACL|nr:YkoF family thiamine/hydroxymethylpyrimidine-binding protein [Sporosarcina highlanderae]MDN4608345.1 YkoF family thiamine/hydroxymethylpyrimidine-binding protein [Sporosarcina highlanderae]
MKCGLSPIVGFRFSLYPMADDFVSVIKKALEETDTSNVWMHTDDVSTVIRGKQVHVFNVAKAISLHAAKTGKHIALSGTFSAGCPGDTAGDVYLDKEDEVLNTDTTKQYVSSQFALYPMNNPAYMDIIYREVDRAKEQGMFNESMHYASGIHGDIHDVFAFYEEAFSNARSEEHKHLVMTVSMSINSPSHGGL